MTTLRITLLLLALLPLTTTALDDQEIYEFVEAFGLPPGVLPDSVTSHEIVPTENGYSLIINLKNACYIKYGDYLVHFDSKITGTISIQQITNLKGLTATSYPTWLNVDEITLTDEVDKIRFSIGATNVDIDYTRFETIPTCKDSTLGACHHSSSLISKV